MIREAAGLRVAEPSLGMKALKLAESTLYHPSWALRKHRRNFPMAIPL